MRNFYHFFIKICLFCAPVLVFSQEYVRMWGTYFGPTGTDLTHVQYREANFDAVQNLHLTGTVITDAAYSNAYYNQFVSGGTGYDITKNSNFLHADFTPAGSLAYAGYNGNPMLLNYEHISYDNAGNSYGWQYAHAGLSAPGTAGTWFPSAVSGVADKAMLTKTSSTGNVLWKTFLPNDNYYFNLTHDSAGNTYIIGKTYAQTGIATPGVFQENFEIIVNNGTVQDNSFIVKLNPDGQMVWCTYFPADLIYYLKSFGDYIYIVSSSDLNPNGAVLATPNAFQNQKSSCSFTKMDANTGNRIWGTYYGPSSGNVTLPSGMAVNADGIYLIGDTLDFAGNTTYFGTPGSHQPAEAGNSDIYLTKFGHNGNRIWSTYFGSPGQEGSVLSSSPIVLIGKDIYITFMQFPNSTANMATPGAYISTPPSVASSNGYHNFLFSKFDSDGALQWCSYYGGANKYIPTGANISIASPNANTFYLYGSTTAVTGIASAGAYQPGMVPNAQNGFVARFDKKVMATTETDLTRDLVLYDNPNNGNFSLSGTILQKQACIMKIYDAAGRLVYEQKLSKNKNQHFTLQKFLTKGNYVLEVSADSKNQIKTFKMTVK